MDMNSPCTAFADFRRVASGSIVEVALSVKETLDRDAGASVLIFDDRTSRQVEVDLRGSAADVRERLTAAASPPETAPPARGPGRPKLGVVSREVTLLPRHWEWLNAQPGGA